MINSVTFYFGSSPTSAPLTIDPRPITVLVGPNNSGKSSALREIETWCKIGPQQLRKVVAQLDVDLPDAERALTDLEPFKKSPGAGQVIQEGVVTVRRPDPHQEGMADQQFHEPSFRVQWNARDWTWVSQFYLAFFTVRLDGRTRFSLTQPRSSGDLQDLPQNHLAALFRDDEARVKIRTIVEDAFGLHLVIDPTGMTQFRIRMSGRAPSDNQEEQALDERARSFHGAATDILELSDGVQAFSGILAAVLSANYKIVMLDEPEAFLAPALRRKLGSRLATLSQEREGTLLAATHDANFLMGCVQSGANINVVRLTHRKGNATARLLQPETLVRFMRDPLLRSTNVLDALFHESAVVTEADTDRAFYQEINERLLSSDREGIDDCLFLNARNKQTVPQIAGPLREIGIPAAMIVRHRRPEGRRTSLDQTSRCGERARDFQNGSKQLPGGGKAGVRRVGQGHEEGRRCRSLGERCAGVLREPARPTGRSRRFRRAWRGGRGLASRAWRHRPWCHAAHTTTRLRRKWVPARRQGLDLDINPWPRPPPQQLRRPFPVTRGSRCRA